MRKIEAEINILRGEPERATDIPLTNFRGIEIRHFAAEVARLALVIAEYQCDELYRGQRLALAEFLPLDNQNWITHGNALRLDWLKVCPPTGTSGIKLHEDDLFQTPLDQPEIDFENEGGETYICGNPPYKGTKSQTDEQKHELKDLFSAFEGSYKVLDYVAGWFVKAAQYIQNKPGGAALVSTNSVCQGNQVPILWPLLRRMGIYISFAHTSFKWSNLASHNAGVTVIVVGLSAVSQSHRRLFVWENGVETERHVGNINAYLVPADDVYIARRSAPPPGCDSMVLGNQPYEGGYLIMSRDEVSALNLDNTSKQQFVRRILGSSEVIKGTERFCLWIEDRNLSSAMEFEPIAHRISSVESWRKSSKRPATRAMANKPHQFCEMKAGDSSVLIIPIRSSENREYLPIAMYGSDTTVSNLAYAMYDAELFNFSLIASRLHLVWISTVCGKLETRFSYSNKMGWNTFPVPDLTELNKAELTRCAEDILLAREAHWPATIAELYDPEKMPADLRAAHDRNDEMLERIYIGRGFKNDTGRLETLFKMYTEMTAKEGVKT